MGRAFHAVYDICMIHSVLEAWSLVIINMQLMMGLMSHHPLSTQSILMPSAKPFPLAERSPKRYMPVLLIPSASPEPP